MAISLSLPAGRLPTNGPYRHREPPLDSRGGLRPSRNCLFGMVYGGEVLQDAGHSGPGGRPGRSADKQTVSQWGFTSQTADFPRRCNIQQMLNAFQITRKKCLSRRWRGIRRRERLWLDSRTRPSDLAAETEAVGSESGEECECAAVVAVFGNLIITG